MYASTIVPSLTFWNTCCDHTQSGCPSEVVAPDAGRNKGAIGVGDSCDSPRKTRKTRLTEFHDPKQRSGSSGVLTVSFFPLKDCQDSVQNAFSGSTDSHSLSAVLRTSEVGGILYMGISPPAGPLERWGHEW